MTRKYNLLKPLQPQRCHFPGQEMLKEDSYSLSPILSLHFQHCSLHFVAKFTVAQIFKLTQSPPELSGIQGLQAF